MTYNSVIHHEQGGSVLTVESTGSIAVAAGGTISGAGTIGLTGGITSTGNVTATSLTVEQTGGYVQLGTFVQIIFSASVEAPSALPWSASPGAVFFRSDGSMSMGYINTSDGESGSIWTSLA